MSRRRRYQILISGEIATYQVGEPILSHTNFSMTRATIQTDVGIQFRLKVEGILHESRYILLCLPQSQQRFPSPRWTTH